MVPNLRGYNEIKLVQYRLRVLLAHKSQCQDVQTWSSKHILYSLAPSLHAIL